MRLKLLLFLMIFFISLKAFSQDTGEIFKEKNYSIHWQATTIPQYHFNFLSPYTGKNSLLPNEPIKASITSTLFTAYTPFKNTYFVFDPEAAGGKGFSGTSGIAGFPNGEVYRVGDPHIQPYIARLYVEQRFPLSKKIDTIETDQNQIQQTTRKDYISITAGKVSITDFFDNSSVSHDPRTQFLNWALFGSGAWDYPANTRGYDFAAIFKIVYHDWGFKYANTFEPTTANGPNLEWKGTDAMGQVWEIEKRNIFKKDNDENNTNFHLGIFWNRADMGNYQIAIDSGIAENKAPNIVSTRAFGRSKWGFYDALEMNKGALHFTLKSSWNDGQNETWAFTEIDRSYVEAIRADGNLWNRKNDAAGIAFLENGISDAHRQYLADGGYGFIIGDGQLNYGMEDIAEAYYSFNIFKIFFVSPDYQFVLHPAYNKERGPVNIVSLRLHVAL
jgi:high affinity Mn2+ porin